jgi:WD40 repeat protein
LDHKNVRVLNETEDFFSVAWSPDGKKLAAGGLIMQDSEIGKPHLVVWDISSWKVVFEPKLDDSMTDTLYGDVAWSPDGRFLATSNGYMGVTTFNIQSGKVISKQDIFSGAVSDISWSPDCSRLVSTGDIAYAIRRWRVDTDDWVRLFNPRASFSLAVQWSPDGKRIASGHTGGAVCFWTAETNECDGFIQAHQSATFSLAWSPDGTRLATGGGIIRIWNTQTGLLDTSFGLSDTSVYSKLAWPNPDLLISLEAGYEEEMPTIVRFWDLSTGKILMEFQGANGLLWQ